MEKKFSLKFDDINESLVLELSSMGIDAFNLEDPFFNKICITFTSDDGKDVTLSDRISYYYRNTPHLHDMKLYFPSWP